MAEPDIRPARQRRGDGWRGHNRMPRLAFSAKACFVHVSARGHCGL